MILMVARERLDVMPSRFRLIPVDVEAIHLTDDDSIQRAVAWSGGVISDDSVSLYVATTNSILTLERGDYLVKEGGYFTKMSEKEFESKYERI